MVLVIFLFHSTLLFILFCPTQLHLMKWRQHPTDSPDIWSPNNILHRTLKQLMSGVTEHDKQRRHTCSECTTTMTSQHRSLIGRRWRTGEQTYSRLSAGRWQQTNTVAVLLRNKPVILQNTNTDSDRLLQVHTTSEVFGFKGGGLGPNQIRPLNPSGLFTDFNQSLVRWWSLTAGLSVKIN